MCSGTVVYREAFPVIVQLAVMLHTSIHRSREGGLGWLTIKSSWRFDICVCIHKVRNKRLKCDQSGPNHDCRILSS